MISTDLNGHAIPGPWRSRYLRAWSKAFPAPGGRRPGNFDDIGWHTQTPAWDSWWFEECGVKPPRSIYGLLCKR